MGLFGFDSVSDMFDGGGRGGSGSEYSTKSHENYKKEYREKHREDDPLANSHSTTDDDPVVVETDSFGEYPLPINNAASPINVSKQSHVPPRVLNAVAKTTLDYINAVNEGKIKSQITLSDINIVIANISPLNNGIEVLGLRLSDNENTIFIDFDEGLEDRLASDESFAATALHELTHIYNPDYHLSDVENPNAKHSKNFYDLVDEAAMIIDVDPGISGTGHPNAIGAMDYNGDNEPIYQIGEQNGLALYEKDESDQLRGSGGDDSLYAQKSSTGNKTFLYGESGNDSYTVTSASGEVEVSEENSDSAEDYVYIYDILISEITASESDGDLTLVSEGLNLVVEDAQRIERFYFDSDNVWINGIDYIESYAGLTNAFGENGVLGVVHFIKYGHSAGRIANSDAFVEGGAGEDNLSTGDGEDTLLGYAGNDTIEGKGGADTLIGGAGNDALYGGEGNDLLIGSAGSDTLSGGKGDDTYFIYDSDDIVEGGGGFDKVQVVDDSGINLTIGAWTSVERINGGEGNDMIDARSLDSGVILNGRGGDDIMIGGSGGDTFYADPGDDYLYGQQGSDAMIGSSGDDRLEGGGGNDFNYGGEGNDVFVFRHGYGRDVIKDFTDGYDVLNFAGHTEVSSLSDLRIFQSGDHTIVKLAAGGYEQVTLAEFDATNVTSSDFVFG